MEQEEIWDEIALPWNHFRNIPMEEVREFLKDKKGRILDLCCGSGRHFPLIKGVVYGIDFSEKMIDYSRRRCEELGLKCVLKKSSADFSICS